VYAYFFSSGMISIAVDYLVACPDKTYENAAFDGRVPLLLLLPLLTTEKMLKVADIVFVDSTPLLCAAADW
jgi:hypothetical protein